MVCGSIVGASGGSRCGSAWVADGARSSGSDLLQPAAKVRHTMPRRIEGTDLIATAAPSCCKIELDTSLDGLRKAKVNSASVLACC